jgi:copper(I)-binding protein
MRSSRRFWPSRASGWQLRSAAAWLAFAVAACGQAGASPGPMLVRDAWLRVPVSGASAGYLVIENQTGQADVLRAVTLPEGGSAALHRTTTDDSGMTGMEPVADGIHVPAGGTVTLEPGGFHVMLTGLPSGLAPGDHVAVRLEFDDAGVIVVQAEVRAG